MKCRVLTAVLLGVFSVSSYGAKKSCMDSVDMSLLREKVGSYSEFYGDLPDRINCSRPVGNQKLICQNDVLRFMEKLDHIGTVYAEENGTKRELDHGKRYGTGWLNEMLKNCRTEDCVCSEYKKSAESSLGGESPYYEP